MERQGLPTHGKKGRIALAVALLTASAAVVACGEDSLAPEGTARVQILLTDAPSDMLDSAHVWISRVYLVGGGGAEPDTAEADTLDSGAGKVDLFNDPANPWRFDLLQLRGGLTEDVTGLVEVDATAYRGLRFVIDSTRVTLAEGYVFEDGSRVGSMKVPSGQRSGVKVKLRDIMQTSENETLVITVDFDVDQNFQIQLHPQTGAVRKILFKPVLKELGRDRS